ncbi:uncharacterized protein [Oryctolagus cuniculus]|uniref:uncharacterized protein n=1 Tax=Oryctolagus cuniculus TaxID=9986 RepID=UPI003879C146
MTGSTPRASARIPARRGTLRAPPRLGAGLPAPAERTDPRHPLSPIGSFWGWEGQTPRAYPDSTAQAQTPGSQRPSDSTPAPQGADATASQRVPVAHPATARHRPRLHAPHWHPHPAARSASPRPCSWSGPPGASLSRRCAAARPNSGSLWGPGALGLTPISPISTTGYLVHALQTTLWTFPLLFKSPHGKRGKKKIPEEIRMNWKEKKNIQQGVHGGEKAQTPPTFKRQLGVQEGVGRPGTLSHIAPLSQPKRTTAPAERGPLLGAGHRGASQAPQQVGTTPFTHTHTHTHPPSSLESTSVANTIVRLLFPTPVGPTNDQSVVTTTALDLPLTPNSSWHYMPLPLEVLWYETGLG